MGKRAKYAFGDERLDFSDGQQAGAVLKYMVEHIRYAAYELDKPTRDWLITELSHWSSIMRGRPGERDESVALTDAFITYLKCG